MPFPGVLPLSAVDAIQGLFSAESEKTRMESRSEQSHHFWACDLGAVEQCRSGTATRIPESRTEGGLTEVR